MSEEGQAGPDTATMSCYGQHAHARALLQPPCCMCMWGQAAGSVGEGQAVCTCVCVCVGGGIMTNQCEWCN